MYRVYVENKFCKGARILQSRFYEKMTFVKTGKSYKWCFAMNSVIIYEKSGLKLLLEFIFRENSVNTLKTITCFKLWDFDYHKSI